MKSKFLSVATMVAASLSLVGCGNAGNSAQAPAEITNDEVILHAWSWSFNTVADNMKVIADAGEPALAVPAVHSSHMHVGRRLRGRAMHHNQVDLARFRSADSLQNR